MVIYYDKNCYLATEKLFSNIISEQAQTHISEILSSEGFIMCEKGMWCKDSVVFIFLPFSLLPNEYASYKNKLSSHLQR